LTFLPMHVIYQLAHRQGRRYVAPDPTTPSLRGRLTENGASVTRSGGTLPGSWK
jgi:hypothetical protein